MQPHKPLCTWMFTHKQTLLLCAAHLLSSNMLWRTDIFFFSQSSALWDILLFHFIHEECSIMTWVVIHFVYSTIITRIVIQRLWTAWLVISAPIKLCRGFGTSPEWCPTNRVHSSHYRHGDFIPACSVCCKPAPLSLTSHFLSLFTATAHKGNKEPKEK